MRYSGNAGAPPFWQQPGKATPCNIQRKQRKQEGGRREAGVVCGRKPVELN